MCEVLLIRRSQLTLQFQFPKSPYNVPRYTKVTFRSTKAANLKGSIRTLALSQTPITLRNGITNSTPYFQGGLFT